MRSTFLFLSLLAVSNACWFQSRGSTVRRLVRFASKQGVDIDAGFTAEALDDALRKLPSGISWASTKAGGTAKIMQRCDLDGDGFIRVSELFQESECLDSCWKQVAIASFL